MQVAMMPESTLSIHVVRGVVEAAEQAGVSRAELLRAARLEGVPLDATDGWVTHADVFRLCEHAVELSRDPAFALHWAEHLSANTFNPVSHLVAHAATLRHGIQSLFEFHRLLNHKSSFELSETADTVTLRYAPFEGASLRMQRFAAEMMVMGFYRLVRSFDSRAAFIRVSFHYSAPSYREEYERLFGRAERFDESFTGVQFHRALMDAPSPYRDPDVHSALRNIAERRVLRLMKREPFAARVRDLLVRQGTTHHVDMDAVARALGLSTRSLRRRLAAEGTSFHVVVNEALAIVARHLLQHRHLTIQETAYEMGFADPSCFHRAFRRWTGMTPKAFRESGLEQLTPYEHV